MNQNSQHLRQLIFQNASMLREFAIASGLVYQYKDHGKEVTDNCPCTIIPKAIDKSQLEDLKQKQKILQKMIHAMGNDSEYYTKVMKKYEVQFIPRMTQSDEFSRNMLEIQQKVLKSTTASVSQPIYQKKYNFCFVRNDVMHHEPTNKYYQVEFNCIAVSFPFISDKVQTFHDMLLKSHLKDFLPNYKTIIDPNAALMTQGVLDCYNIYNVPEAKVLVVVSDFEGNVFDQRYLEISIATHGILSVRATFPDLIKHLQLDETTGKLSYKDDEIFFVYFRHGYTANHYEDQDHWLAREKIELSRAIKCPSMNTQIINFKKFQEYTQYESELKQFLTDEEQKRLRENFCCIYGFDDPNTHESLLNMIRDRPDKYVLKPQREGGGNNFYGKQILDVLESLAPERRTEFTLMMRYKPKPHTTITMRRGELLEQECISEIGIYGYYLANGSEMLKNEVGGYLVRTKSSNVDEGGVATGYAAIDSLVELV